MQVEIITPEALVYEGEADAMRLPGSDGSFGVLDNHAPMVANLAAGTVAWDISGKSETYEIKGGTVEIQNNKVTVLAI